MGNAIVASEDRSFYTNKGIDLYGIARALYTNLTTGSRQGGSTITQQYAERYYLGETTSYSGKLREAFLAIKIAQAQDKSQVLCNYMNTIYLGRGAYGIQAAAKAYFNKNASDLTLSESAMLAGIIPAPSSWDPAVNQEQAEKRYDRVLSIMKEDGYITAQEKKEAQFPAVAEIQQSNQMAGANGYLLTTVKNELVNSKAFTADDLETGGYKIVTTLDKDMQDEIQQVGDTRPEGMPESIQVGGIAVDQKTGSVKAMYAGNDYLTKQLNNATQATFEPGSTMKPFGLLGAAQEGVNFNTIFNGNSGLTFETTPGTTAQVPNALNTNWGYINLYQATANSVNTVFMDVNKHLGAANLAKIAHQAGIEGDIAEDTTYNILGINGITVWGSGSGPLHHCQRWCEKTRYTSSTRCSRPTVRRNCTRQRRRTSRYSTQTIATWCRRPCRAPPRTAPRPVFRHVSDARWPASPAPRMMRRPLRSWATRRSCSMCGPFGILRKTAARRKCHRSQAMAFPPRATRRICSRSLCRSHCRIRRC